jgi:hypothetical protein
MATAVMGRSRILLSTSLTKVRTSDLTRDVAPDAFRQPSPPCGPRLFENCAGARDRRRRQPRSGGLLEWTSFVEVLAVLADLQVVLPDRQQLLVAVEPRGHVGLLKSLPDADFSLSNVDLPAASSMAFTSASLGRLTAPSALPSGLSGGGHGKKCRDGSGQNCGCQEREAVHDGFSR